MAYKPFIKLANDEMVELPLCAEKVGVNTIGSTSEPIYLDSGSPKKCTALKSMIVDLVYPVGSYFITESANFNTTTKVANYFGGTWTRVEGRFLYGSSSAGGTGGSNDATLVSHNHTFTGNTMTGKYGTQKGPSNKSPYGFLYRSPDQSLNDVYASGVFSKDNNSGDKGTFGSGNIGAIYVGISFSGTPSGTISTEGSSATNANMPAYRTVYMYRRTA